MPLYVCFQFNFEAKVPYKGVVCSRFCQIQYPENKVIYLLGWIIHNVGVFIENGGRFSRVVVV